jgi:XTP/dITP diphosphohydrolase
MIKRFESGAKLVLASHNKGKIFEFRGLLAPHQIGVVSSAELGITEPEETGDTFVANAALKAEVTAKASGLPALADDSGLEVEALGGAPGIYSARWAGEPRDFYAAMARVERELAARDQASTVANFTCVLCLAMPDGATRIFEGKVFGHLTFPPRGTNGFGYDPIFVPDGYTQTFGEMDPEAKQLISHRHVAFTAFAQAILQIRNSAARE